MRSYIRGGFRKLTTEVRWRSTFEAIGEVDHDGGKEERYRSLLTSCICARAPLEGGRSVRGEALGKGKVESEW